MELFLDYAFAPLSGVVDTNEFTSVYSLQLAIVIYLHASMEKYVSATCGLPS